MIEAEQMKNRGVDVVDVRLLRLRAQADGIGGADHLPAFHARAGEPHGEAVRIVVAAVLSFAHRHAAKFAAPNDERGIQQPARFQILQQAGNRADRFARRASSDCLPYRSGRPSRSYRRNRVARSARRSRPAAARAGNACRTPRSLCLSRP